MDVDKISEILSQDDSHDNLCNYLLSNITKVKEIVVSSCRQSKGPSIIKDIMIALNKEEQVGKTEALRLNVTMYILKEVFNNNSIPNINAIKYLDCMDLENFNDNSINKVYEKCHAALEAESITNYRWLPFIGRILSVIQSKEKFRPHDDGEEESGDKFVEANITELCNFNWNLDIVTGMCSFLKVDINFLFVKI